MPVCTCLPKNFGDEVHILVATYKNLGHELDFLQSRFDQREEALRKLVKTWRTRAEEYAPGPGWSKARLECADELEKLL